jgi:hypothetical protein
MVLSLGYIPEQYKSKSKEEMIAYEAMVCVSMVLAPALIILLFARVPLTKKNFREFFFIQCYAQAPLSFVIGLLLLLLKTLNYDFKAMDAENYVPVMNNINGWKDAIMGVVYGVGAWMAVIEYIVIRKHTNCTSGRAILIIVLSFFLFGFAMLASGGIGYLMLNHL